MPVIITFWALAAALGCGLFAALGLWATYTDGEPTRRAVGELHAEVDRVLRGVTP